MNTQTGKSVGIALLLAAGLLAVLFAFGVFSPSGAGAQSSGPTATASLVDPAHLTADTSDTATEVTTDDTLVITFSGLTRQAAPNVITVNMTEDFGTTLGDLSASWKGGSQYEDAPTVGDAPTGDGYMFTLGTGTSIEAGTARLEISSTSANTIDSNTEITGITIGRAGVLQTVSNASASSPLSITNAPAGPSIVLDPASVVLDVAVGTYTVKVSGSGFESDSAVTLAATTDHGTATAPTIAEVVATDIDEDGVFSVERSFVIEANVPTTESAAQTITVTASQGGSPQTTATFVVNRTPSFEAEYDDLFFADEDSAGQAFTVEATDADSHDLTFTASSNDTDVATVSVKEDESSDEMDASINVIPVGPGTATITVQADDGFAGDDVTTTVDVTVLGVNLSSNNADADVTVEVIAQAEGTIRGGNDIVIGMSGFGVPDSIDEDEIIIDGRASVDTGRMDSAGNTIYSSSYYGNPASVSVSGSSITITVPTKVVGAGGQSIDTQIHPGGYTVSFKAGAGLSNPNSAGSKEITVDDGDATNHELPVQIVSHVSRKPSWVSRGDAVTVTGKGVNPDGDATVHLVTGMTADQVNAGDGEDLVDELVLGRALRDAGTVVVEVDTSGSSFDAGAVDAKGDDHAGGTNLIAMVDAAGNVVGTTTIGILPTVKLDVSEVRRSGRMTVTVSDWYYGNIYEIRVNGILVDLPDTDTDDDTAADAWKRNIPASDAEGDGLVVIVDRSVRLGEMEVAVSGTTFVKQGSAGSRDIHKQTVDVGVFDLDITPSTAVIDQVIRVEGTGFTGRSCVESITVGGRVIEESTSGNDIGAVEGCVRTDSNGQLADSFRVPDGLKVGEHTMIITDASNRVGEGVLTIPEPVITLDPMSSQRGSTVTIVGSNFPAEDLVTVAYGADEDTVTTTTTDTVGRWRATFEVPIDATIGADHPVVAASEKKADGMDDRKPKLSASVDHNVPDETLDLSSDEVASGGRLGITATNLPLFTPVSITIGGIGAAGRVIGEDDASDGTGVYETVLLVPQLTVGTHTVELTVHTVGADVSVARFVEILDIVTRPTDEVFEDLIEAGILTVVWRYDNATGTWASYDPAAPAEVNDLDLVSTDDIVWVQTTADYEFQGNDYLAGWNLYSLE